MNTELKLWGLWLSGQKYGPDELVKKLEKIYIGGKVFSDEVMVEVLTPREIEILELVRNGLTIDDVCDKVYVSKRTVPITWPISFQNWE